MGLIKSTPFCGDSIKGGDTLTWFKFGDLVLISCAVWNFEIVNPTDAALNLSLPFKNMTVRAIGIMGYNNSGINIILVSSENLSHFSFAVKNSNGSTTDIKGNQLPKCILQFNLIYETE